MEWPDILDESLNTIYKNQNEINEFKNLESNYARIDFLVSRNSYLSKIDHFLTNLYKNCDKIEAKDLNSSDTYRKEGNKYYSKKDNKNSFKYYTFALLNAPENKALILAYSNRSAVFYDQNMYDKCLQDISLVKNILTNEYLDKLSDLDLKELLNLIFKLLNREVNSLIKLNSIENLRNFEENYFYSILNTKKFENLNLIQKEIDKFLNSPILINPESNSLIEEVNKENFLSNSMDIVYSKEKGRHCLANREIKPGEYLFIEKAYCAILLPEFNFSYCANCFKAIYDSNKDEYLFLNLQSCSKCSSVLYCSEECKNENKDRHRFECRVLKTLLHNLGIAHLAYRILISTKDDLVDKYSKLDVIQNDNQVDLMKIDYRLDEIEANYKQVYYLLTHEKETHFEDLFKYSLTSLLLARHYLNIKKENSLTQLKQISGLILRHLLQTICNAHAMTQLKDECNNDQKETYDRSQVRYATAIYPRVSLLNHSCNSNVISSFMQNSSTIVVKAARRIENGQEIYNCYGPHYLKMSLFERRQSLFEQYRFECDCDACLNQLKSIESSENLGLRCFKCKRDKIQSEKLTKLKCLNCNFEFSIQIYIQAFEKLNSEFSKFDLNNLSKEKCLGYILKLENMLKEYQVYLLVTEEIQLEKGIRIEENFKIFYLDFTKVVDLMSRLNCNLRRFEKACELIEKNVKILEFIYNSGSDMQKSNESSIEIAHELFKLAEIQCNCQMFRKALENVNKAILIAEKVYSKENQIIQEFFSLKQNILSILEN